ncbi:MAG: hypothetical protein ACU0CI_06615 [Shimia sp.]
MSSPLPPVFSFWTGSRLSWLEQACLASFRDAGHAVTLYTLGEVGPVPDGIAVRRAEYTPPCPIPIESRHDAAVFSDLFRLHMMTRDAGIWVDCDAYCLRPFADLGPFVLGRGPQGQILNGVLRLPQWSRTLAAMLDFVARPNPIQPWRGEGYRSGRARAAERGRTWTIRDLPWGCSGPKLLTHFAQESGEARHAMAPDVLFPLEGRALTSLLERAAPLEGIEGNPATLSIHIYGMVRKTLCARNAGLPPAGSWLEAICHRHGIAPADAPIPDDILT